MAPLPYREELCVDVWLVWEQKLPESFQQLESPLTGRDYVVDHVHEAYHHYLKASRRTTLIDRQLLAPYTPVHPSADLTHTYGHGGDDVALLQVVSTHYEVGSGLGSGNTVLQYQMVVQR